MGEIIRQTDNVRITERCYEKTYYPWDDNRKCIWPTCKYLKNGTCELTVCVRREKRNAKT